jgi:sulfopyruvate decarboxylase subunit beta
MKRIEAIQYVVNLVSKELVISNLGYPSQELYYVKDRPKNFYMLGSMGLASSIGLGLALARKNDRVIAFDGDGSILMNLGSLATIANQKPPNLILVILDNESYATTGGQKSYTAGATKVEALARAAGISKTKMVRTKRGLTRAINEALRLTVPAVIVAKVEKGNANVPQIPLRLEEIKERFMKSLE